MSFKSISKLPFARKLLRLLAQWRVQEKLGHLLPHLPPSSSVLDVGAGNCVLLNELRKRNYRVIGLDIDNLSLLENVHPVIYAGGRLPFGDRCFDVTLLITVLHHIPQPEATLAEARRVSGRIVVMEEIYSNALEKHLTHFVDSVFNCEFRGHPHSNKTDAGWRAVFKQLGLRIISAQYSCSLGVLKRATYVLESPLGL